MEDVGGEDLIRLVNQESASQAQNIFESSYQSIAKVETCLELELSLHPVHRDCQHIHHVSNPSVTG
jgi:hypothetical protein